MRRPPRPATRASPCSGSRTRCPSPGANNHSLAASALELDKTEERSAATRTQRYPGFKLDAVGLRLLNSPEFTYPAGSFGTYAGVGQVPATDTTVFVRDLRIVRWDAEEQPKAPPPREDPHPVLPSAA